jgi:lysophospholipase L1-like esterase
MVLETLGPACEQALQGDVMNGAIAPSKVTAPAAKIPVLPTPVLPAIAPISLDATPTLTNPCPTPQKKPGICEAEPQVQPVARQNDALTAAPILTPQRIVPSIAPRGPTSGGQLYRQRQLALQAGHLYTRLPAESFAQQWRSATQSPTYQDWRQLLDQEAQAIATGQGHNRLEVIVGDSLGLWLPAETLPRDRLWLNQSISGDTTAGVLRRLNTFAATRPTVIHLMIGVNDLKNNVPEAEIVANLRAIITQLQRQHPQAQLVLYSVLPTRRDDIGNGRVRSLNHHIAYLASHHQIDHRDMLNLFGDQGGALRTDLTTDGLHLNRQGLQSLAAGHRCSRQPGLTRLRH